MPAKGARAGYRRLGPLALARFHTRQHYSGALEMWVVFTFLWWHREALTGKDLLMFVDNVGVLALLAKGAAAPDDLSHVVGLCYLLLARHRIRVWW